MFVRLLVYIPAIVLGIASFLKTLQLYLSPWEIGALSAAWSILIIEVEILVFFLMLSGWKFRFVKLLALGLFAIFGIYSTIAIFSGQQQCGCFGAFEVSPIQALTLDVICILMLFFSSNYAQLNERKSAAMIGWGFSALLALAVFAFPNSAVMNKTGTIIGDGKSVLIEPDTWSNQRFPLAKFVDGSFKFASDEMQVLLYKEDCRKCSDAIASIKRNSKNIPTLFLSIDSGGSSESPLDGQTQKWRRLTREFKWFAEVPILVHVSHDVVTSVTRL